MKRPIMLWITSRSRSSMVSNIFIHHGIWWGDTIATQDYIEEKEHKSYVSYENQNIKQLLFKYKQRYWKKVHLTPVFPVEGFVDELSHLLPSNQTWMMKTGVEYFNAFKELNPYNIFIKRSPEGVATSLSSKRKDVIYEEALHAAEWRFDYMDKLQEQYGGISVNTDDIIQNNFTDMKKAIEYCGLTFSEESAREAIVR